MGTSGDTVQPVWVFLGTIQVPHAPSFNPPKPLEGELGRIRSPGRLTSDLQPPILCPLCPPPGPPQTGHCAQRGRPEPSQPFPRPPEHVTVLQLPPPSTATLLADGRKVIGPDSVLETKVSATAWALRSKSRDASDLSSSLEPNFSPSWFRVFVRLRGKDPGDTGHVGAQLVSGAATKAAGPRELQGVGAERAFSRAELLPLTGPRRCPRPPRVL